MAVSQDQLREFVRAGIHIGHRRSRRHPRMRPYVFGMRGNTEIIDVEKTVEALERAAAALEEITAKGGTILFVGTRPSHADLVRQTAEELGMPFVTARWIGGTLTNFSVIGKRLEAFRTLAEREASGELKERYTRAERVRFQRQLARLQAELGGIRELTKLPDALVVVSLRSDQLAAREARKKGIPVVAIVDTDADPALVEYPVPANDDALPAVQYLLGKFADAVKRGKTKAKIVKAAKAAEDAKAPAKGDKGDKEELGGKGGKRVEGDKKDNG